MMFEGKGGVNITCKHRPECFKPGWQGRDTVSSPLLSVHTTTLRESYSPTGCLGLGIAGGQANGDVY